MDSVGRVLPSALHAAMAVHDPPEMARVPLERTVTVAFGLLGSFGGQGGAGIFLLCASQLF